MKKSKFTDQQIAFGLKQEVLDHFIVFGRAHLNVLCREFRDQYHLERPHQGLNTDLIIAPRKKPRGNKPLDPTHLTIRDIQCRERLGGLLKSYSRRAA